MAHIILIDPHKRIPAGFSERQAEVINIDNLQLPFWLFRTFEGGGSAYWSAAETAQEQEGSSTDPERRYYPARDAATRARATSSTTPERGYSRRRLGYPISFVSIYEAMGKLDKAGHFDALPAA